jgi:hypothetical protein
VWKNATFWLKWFEQETKDNKLNITKEEISVVILRSIADVMYMLKIEGKYIFELIINDLGEQFVKDVCYT